MFCYDVASKVQNKVSREGFSEFGRLEQEITGGSATASRGAADQALNDNMVVDALKSATSPMGGGLASRVVKGGLKIASRAVDKYGKGINVGTADAGSDFLLAGTPGKASLADAQRLLAIRKIAQMQRAKLTAQLGAGAANLSQQP